jgi:hypothetical protein
LRDTLPPLTPSCRQRCLPLPKIFAAPRRHMSYAIYARCLPLSFRCRLLSATADAMPLAFVATAAERCFSGCRSMAFRRLRRRYCRRHASPRGYATFVRSEAHAAAIAAAAVAASLRYAPPRQIRRLPPAFFAMKPAAIHADSAAA